MRPRVWLTAALCVSGVVHADPQDDDIYVPAPERPYLLLDARRRYLTTEHAHVYVERRGGGAVRLALFRVRDARAFVEASVSRQGVSIALGAWGDDAEALLHATAPLPRAGSRLTLVSLRDVATQVTETARRAVGDETAAYDSSENDEGLVETWGVSAGRWGVADVDLGALPAGTYVARALDGMWATSALVSVGDTVVVTRRGDARDVVHVSGPDGAALANVDVEAVAGDTSVRARTDAQGDADVPASAVPARRVYVSRGDELAWTDVVHTQLPPCDTRVYLGTGRPVYRAGDEVRVRGHVRGCRPMGGARVRVFPTRAGADGETVVADAEGNFTATLIAARDIGAEVDGRLHPRTLNLDHRPLPQSSVRVSFDRAWAAAGERATVTAWPSAGSRLQRVQFRWPGGTSAAAFTGDQPATVTITLPPTERSLERFTVDATATGVGEAIVGHATLWTGHTREVLSLSGDTSQGAVDGTQPLTLDARDLGGAPAPGAVTLTVSGSDGNRAVGPARWTGAAQVLPSGRVETSVRLAGAGPWWVTATRGDAHAETVVWERSRPPTLAGRGSFAVLPESDSVAPGEALRLSVRAPGPTWVTLEQGGVWAAQRVTPGADGIAHLAFDPPAGARGLATVVATRVHAGRVETASAVAEVASAERFTMTVTSDRTTYDPGAHARVIVRTRTISRRPKDAVLTAWLEDVSWWSLGDERQPTVDAYFRGTGRPASGGDSTQPLGYGAEEGRRLDSGMFWNRERVEGTTFRHAWGHGSSLANLHTRGNMAALATSLAHAAGLQGATMCPARVRTMGTVDLEVRDLPWDLAASKLADRTQTFVIRTGNTLSFRCDEPAMHGSGMGSGSGLGGGGGAGTGSAGIGGPNERLEGTRWFLAAQHTGPNGEVTLDVPMPETAGRWRLHTLAIADDGAGAEADTDLDTVAPYMASVRIARAVAPTDEVEGEVQVRSANHDTRPFALRVDVDGAMSLMTAALVTLTPDAEGIARTTFRVRANAAGASRIVARATRDGHVLDAAESAVTVRADRAEQSVDYRAVVTETATDVDLPIPTLAAPATLRVRVDGSLAASVREALEDLRAPRWQLGAMHVDRLVSMRALESAVATLPAAEAGPLRTELQRAIAGEVSALRAMRGSDGEIAWWSRMPGNGDLTATAVALRAGTPSAWPSAWTSLRAQASTASGRSAGLLAAALAQGTPADRALAVALIDRTDSNDLAALTWALEAARHLRDTARVVRIAGSLRTVLDRSISDDRRVPCAGPAWFLCLARQGTRGTVAAAARVLLEADAASRPWALRAAGWLSRNPDETRWWTWGSAEADVLALLARLGPTGRTGSLFVARMGDSVLAHGDASAGVDVTVRESGTLRLSFEGAPGRFARVSVSGTMRLAPPGAGMGPATLVRAFSGGDDARVMTLSFVLPRDADQVEIHAPIPAGDEYAQGAGTPVQQRDPAGSWAPLDGPVGDATAQVSRLDDGVRVRFAHLTAGPHAVRIPLVTIGRGIFHAAPAWLRSAGDAAWSVTPAFVTPR